LIFWVVAIFLLLVLALRPLRRPFCLIFAHTAQRLVLDGTNGLSSSKPCAYCRTVESELKPEVVLATIIDLERCKSPQDDYKWAGIALLTSPTSFLLVARSDHTNGSRNIKPEVVFKVQKMARYSSFCFIMGSFNHFTACKPDFSGTQENTAHLSAGIIRHICTAYSAPPGVQYIAVCGVNNQYGYVWAIMQAQFHRMPGFLDIFHSHYSQRAAHISKNNFLTGIPPWGYIS